MNLPAHLGGHLNITHLDESLINYFIENYNIKSFLDIGCGPGGMVLLAKSKNLDALGIDGDYSLRLDKNFVIHDYTNGPYIPEKKYDLVYSCEFVEHVEEKFVENFMRTFQAGKIICMTFAPPGKKGYHHVNLKNHSYWIDLFKKYNMPYDEDLTSKVRSISSMNRNFIRDHGLCFKNESNNY